MLITALRPWAFKGWCRLAPPRQRLPFPQAAMCRAAVRIFGLKAKEQFVGLIAKSVSVKGPPLSVPPVHAAKARGQRPS